MAIPSSTPLPIGNNIDVEATINGWRWLFPSGVQKVIDWSVSGSLWNHPTLQSTETQTDLREVFNNIGYYIQPDFNFLGYFTSTGAKPGYQIAYEAGSEMNISFAYSGRDSTGQTVNDGRFTTNGQTAFCYFPSTDADSTIYRGASGDTWLNWNNSFIQSLTFEPGTNGFALVLHEVLHGLGLKHPHDSGGTGRPTYADLQLDFINRQWVSVMSYDLFENGGDGAYSGSMPIAPMLMDVIALQYLYGESNGSSGNTQYDLSLYSGSFYNTLWDSSGSDTLDAAEVAHGVVVNLASGQATNGIRTHNIGYITTALDALSLQVLGYNPVNWTWLWGEYENVSGSAYGDILEGNQFNNDLNGNDGNDNLEGGAGNDRLDWDPNLRGGIDTLTGGTGDDVYVVDSLYDVIYENAGEGVDTVWVPFDFSLDGSYVEHVKTFRSQPTPVALTGSGWGNQISGGLAGDRLFGLSGDDQLTGLAGNDYLDGGPGTDTAVFETGRTSASVIRTSSGWNVNSNVEGADRLVGVERLSFTDVNIALDLSDRAGIAAKTLGAVFGPSAVDNKPLAGIALALIDGGWSYQTLMGAAIDARLGATHSAAAVVDLLFLNLVGVPAPEADRRQLVSLMADGTFTAASLGVAAAETDINKANIDLVGLTLAGLEYTPWTG